MHFRYDDVNDILNYVYMCVRSFVCEYVSVRVYKVDAVNNMLVNVRHICVNSTLGVMCSFVLKRVT